MLSLRLILAALFMLLRPLPSSADDPYFCPITTCELHDVPPLPVHFPFRLTDIFELGDFPPAPFYCGYQGFDLSCSNTSDTILTLPGGSGPFLVQSIDYGNRSLVLNDPDGCLPKRLLNFSLSGSPFLPENLVNFTLLNCSSAEAASSARGSMHELRKVPCMSGGPGGYEVMSVQTRLYNSSGHGCRVVGNVSVPASQAYTNDLNEDVKLRWDLPGCRRCVSLEMGFCELRTGCSRKVRSTGLPRSAKYGIIIGIGIPGLLFLLGITSYVFSSVRKYHRHRHEGVGTGSGVLRMTIAPPSPFVMGLNRPTIESYPKTKLGASRRLPKASDNTCPICLCEYEAEETLRTIPECNHYFHVNCIDEWLKANGTCPLCRNCPEGSV
ncbi:hypothetical protein MLD38_036319 [Melastoma candidum]|uniref:Uncharacterized protein n=1 Tax=Melastoma candidum TaxID=119954 RepID=A0ACB9LL61_9MYRT|nr:hypothetical protein MLD38_036319 [Melastoma candidum]